MSNLTKRIPTMAKHEICICYEAITIFLTYFTEITLASIKTITLLLYNKFDPFEFNDFLDQILTII